MKRCEQHNHPLVKLDPVFNSVEVCPDCLFWTASQALKREEELRALLTVVCDVSNKERAAASR